MKEVTDELKGRSGDRRRDLVQLFTHANTHVRLKAAIHTLAVAPAAARNQLQMIAEAQWYPQTAEARFMLRGLSDGSYIPK